MNDRQAVQAVKTILQDNLEDPNSQYEPTRTRNWVHTDEPLDSATFPRIRVRKRGPSTSKIIDMGPTFGEQRILILDIQMWNTQPYKWKNTDNAYLTEEEVIKEWQDKIWLAIKNNFSTLKDTYGITGIKLMGEEDPFLVPDMQLMTGITSVRIWYFKDIC
jgi:hypothetical protein